MTAENNGVRVVAVCNPAPPRSGDNVFTFTVTDSGTGQPVVNANVTAGTFNKLTGGGDRQAGRSQGNGIYEVPIKFGIPDTYELDVTVQRTGQPDAQARFTVEAVQGRG